MDRLGMVIKSSWPFRKGQRVSGLELLRAETRQPKSEPGIWLDWWFPAKMGGDIRATTIKIRLI
jgi:hypothetical protein